MVDREPLDGEAIAAAAARLLEEHPEAVLAVMSSFSGIYCEVPASVPLHGQEVIRSGRFWDLVSPESQGAVFDAWRRVRQHGIGTVSVKASDGQRAALYFLDTRESYEVVLAMLVPGDPPAGGMAELGPDVPARSDFGRLWRDDFGRVMKMDAAAEHLIGCEAKDLVGHDPIPWIHPDHAELAYENWIETLTSPGIPRRWRCRHRRGDGSFLWVEITNTNLLQEEGTGLVVSEMMDISDEMAANERAREREELLQRLAESLPSGIVQIELDGAVVYTNTRLHEIIGVHRAVNLRMLFATAVPDDRTRLAASVDRVMGSGADVDLDLRVQRQDLGSERICQVTIRALRDGEGHVSGAVLTVDDVTESTELRRELERRANIDPLTECHNRAATMTALTRTLDQRLPSDLGTGVVFIDLDHFKPINDRLGHAAGDAVLAAVAHRFRLGMRGEDVVGRLGGDEFLIVCPGITRADVGVAVAQRIVDSLREPHVLATGEVVELKASIGVAWSVNEATTADLLVAQADQAMYRAKDRRDGRPVLGGQLTD